MAAQHGEVAIVFGREHAGLTNAELQRCHYHIQIPCDPHYSSLNVAAAAQIICYEVRMAFLAKQGTEEIAEIDWASAHDMEMFYDHLQQVLIAISFLDPRNPRQLINRLRRLFSKARLDRAELNILRGILSTVEKGIVA